MALQDVLRLGKLLEEEGRLSQAFRLYQECLHTERAREDADTRLLLCKSLGRIAGLEGKGDVALHFLEKGLSGSGSAATRRILAGASLEASAIFLERGELPRAFEAAVRAMRMALEGRRVDLTIRAFLSLTDFLGQTGALQAAADMAWSAVQLSQAAGLFRCELAARLASGFLAVERGDRDVASFELARASELALKADLPIETCRLKLALASERKGAGDHAQALLLAREGIEIARALGLEPLLGRFLLFVGAVESAEENPRRNFLRALSFLEQALVLAEARELPRLRWEVLKAMAALYRTRANKDLAAEFEKRADELEGLVFRRLPRKLRGLQWRTRSRTSRPSRETLASSQRPG
jgi:tetratricopeptide (TPR) repeat protein